MSLKLPLPSSLTIIFGDGIYLINDDKHRCRHMCSVTENGLIRKHNRKCVIEMNTLITNIATAKGVPMINVLQTQTCIIKCGLQRYIETSHFRIENEDKQKLM